jgi:hypothetical protein
MSNAPQPIRAAHGARVPARGPRRGLTVISEPKHIPANCDMPLSGSGVRRCKWAGTVETEDGRMVCGHHAKMIAEDSR